MDVAQVALVRRFAAILLVLTLSGCALFPLSAGGADGTCGITVTRASAWVNMMPLRDGESRRSVMQVLVRTDAAEDKLALEPVMHGDDPATLRLVLKREDAGAMAGQAVWRTAYDPDLKAIIILCDGGAELARIDEVTKAR